jgi:serine O-acetyltransferase
MKYDRNTVKAWAGDSQWRALQADLARFRVHGYSGWVSEGFWALVLYRLERSARSSRPRWLWAPARLGLALVRKLFTVITHIALDPNAQIGPGLLIPHVGPVRVGAGVKIGADCALFHVSTIGANLQTGAGATIGDHVFIGCHSSILGPVTIGDSATISANSLVISDVPAGATAIGVPARMILRDPTEDKGCRGSQVLGLSSVPEAHNPGTSTLTG